MDPSCVSDPSAVTPGGTPVVNHFEEMHPKDDFELLHSSMSAEKVSLGTPLPMLLELSFLQRVMFINLIEVDISL